MHLGIGSIELQHIGFEFLVEDLVVGEGVGGLEQGLQFLLVGFEVEKVEIGSVLV